MELLGTLPILLLVLLLMVQVLVAAWAVGRAEWAAWDGARAAARGASQAQIRAAVRAVVGDTLVEPMPPPESTACWAEVQIQVRIPVMVWFLRDAGVELPPVPGRARYPLEGGQCP